MPPRPLFRAFFALAAGVAAPVALHQLAQSGTAITTTTTLLTWCISWVVARLCGSLAASEFPASRPASPARGDGASSSNATRSPNGFQRISAADPEDVDVLYQSDELYEFRDMDRNTPNNNSSDSSLPKRTLIQNFDGNNNNNGHSVASAVVGGTHAVTLSLLVAALAQTDIETYAWINLAAIPLGVTLAMFSHIPVAVLLNWHGARSAPGASTLLRVPLNAIALVVPTALAVTGTVLIALRWRATQHHVIGLLILLAVLGTSAVYHAVLDQSGAAARAGPLRVMASPVAGLAGVMILLPNVITVDLPQVWYEARMLVADPTLNDQIWKQMLALYSTRTPWPAMWAAGVCMGFAMAFPVWTLHESTAPSRALALAVAQALLTTVAGMMFPGARIAHTSGMTVALVGVALCAPAIAWFKSETQRRPDVPCLFSSRDDLVVAYLTVGAAGWRLSESGPWVRRARSLVVGAIALWVSVLVLFWIVGLIASVLRLPESPRPDAGGPESWIGANNLTLSQMAAWTNKSMPAHPPLRASSKRAQVNSASIPSIGGDDADPPSFSLGTEGSAPDSVASLVRKLFLAPESAFDWKASQVNDDGTPRRESIVILMADNRPLMTLDDVRVENLQPQYHDLNMLSMTAVANSLYAARHGYDFQLISMPKLNGRWATWNKVRAIYSALDKHDIAVFIDTDSWWEDPTQSLEALMERWKFHSTASMLLPLDPPGQPRANFNSTNTGFWMVRNTTLSRTALRALWNCPHAVAACKDLAKGFPHEQGAFSRFIRPLMREWDDLVIAPCTDANGYWRHWKCKGAVVIHPWDCKECVVPRVRDWLVRQHWALYRKMLRGSHYVECADGGREDIDACRLSSA